MRKYSEYSNVDFKRTLSPLLDGNTLFLGDYLDAANSITLNTGDQVKWWYDKIGLTKRISALNNYPHLTADGVKFVRAESGNLIGANIGWNQPATLYLVFRINAYVDDTIIFDGDTNALWKTHMQSGFVYSNAVNLGAKPADGAWQIWRLMGKGAQGKIQKNGGAVSVVNLGTNNPLGIAFGSYAEGYAGYSNIEIKGFALRAEDSDPVANLIFAYLNTYYNLGLKCGSILIVQMQQAA